MENIIISSLGETITISDPKIYIDNKNYESEITGLTAQFNDLTSQFNEFETGITNDLNNLETGITSDLNNLETGLTAYTNEKIYDLNAVVTRYRIDTYTYIQLKYILKNSNLENVDLSNMFLFECDFTGCNLTNTNFTNSFMYQAILTNAIGLNSNINTALASINKSVGTLITWVDGNEYEYNGTVWNIVI